MRGRYFTDSQGVVRLRSTGRKRRSDYGTHKPHPLHCRHCESVKAYRETRAAAIERNGGFRNENAHDCVITFKQWLIAQSREWRIERMAA